MFNQILAAYDKCIKCGMSLTSFINIRNGKCTYVYLWKMSLSDLFVFDLSAHGISIC